MTDIKVNVPDHSEDLKELKKFVLNIDEKYDHDIKYRELTEDKLDKYLYMLERTLFMTGSLSMQLDPIKEPLKEYYTEAYKKTPELGDKLYWEKYFSLFKPYDKLKNKIWKIIYKLDERKKRIEENEGRIFS